MKLRATKQGAVFDELRVRTCCSQNCFFDVFCISDKLLTFVNASFLGKLTVTFVYVLLYLWSACAFGFWLNSYWMVWSAYNTTMSMTIGMSHTVESTPHCHILNRKKKEKNTKLVFIAWLLHGIAWTNVGFLCLLTDARSSKSICLGLSVCETSLHLRRKKQATKKTYVSICL